MGLGLNKFAAGFASGYQNEDRRIEARDRQDRMDAMQAEEFGMRKQEFNERQEKLNREKEFDNAEAQVYGAGKVENGVNTVTAPSLDGKKSITSYQPDAEVAQAAAQQDAVERGLPPPGSENEDGSPAVGAPTVGKSSSVRLLDGSRKMFSGIGAAKDAAEFSQANPMSEYARTMALREKLSALPGGRKRADEMLARAKELRSEGVTDAMVQMRSGDLSGAMKTFNSVGQMKFPEGSKIVSAGVGTDPLTRAQKMQYKVVGPSNETLVPDVENAVRAHLIGYKDQAGIEAALAKSDDSADARRYAADMAYQRGLMAGGGRSSGGSGAGGSVGKTNKPLDAVGALMEVQKEAMKGSELSADVLASAREHAARMQNLNQGVDPNVLARAAIDVANGRAKEEPAIDPETGSAYKEVDMGNGTVIKTRPLGITPNDVFGKNGKAFGVDDQTAKAMTAKLYQSLGPEGVAFLDASRDRSGPGGTSYARREIEQKAMDEARMKMEQAPRFAKVAPEVQQKLIEEAYLPKAQRINNILNWLSLHGSDIKKDAPTANVSRKSVEREADFSGFGLPL
jgi:hypothetical protein